MIKSLYLFVSNTTLTLFFLAFVLFYALFEERVALHLAQKYLKEYGIEYALVEGTLYEGIKIKKIKYQDALSADEITVTYDFWELFYPTPRVKTVDAEALFVDVEKTIELNNQNQESLFALNISNINLKKTVVFYKDEKYFIDANLSETAIGDSVNIEKIKALLDTKYAKVPFEASFKNNHLKGQATVEPSKESYDKYLSLLSKKPKKTTVIFDISKKGADFKTSLDETSLKSTEDIAIKDADITINYLFKDDFLTLSLKYKAFYEDFEFFIKQQTKIGFNGIYTSKIEADIIKDSMGVWFNTFKAEIKSDKNGSKIAFLAKDIFVEADTSDYKKFFFNADTKHAKSSGVFETDKEKTLLHGEFYPKKEIPYFKELYLEKFPKLNFFISKNRDEIKANIHDKKFALNISSQDGSNIKGEAHIGSLKVDILGDLNKKTIDFASKTDSLYSLLREFELIDGSYDFDAKVKINGVLSYRDKIEVKTKLDLPWYRVKIDSLSDYSSRDAFFEFFYHEGEVRLQKYGFELFGYKIESQKPSHVIIDENTNIAFKELWVYDNILIKGLFRVDEMSLDVDIKSEKFLYKTKDFDLILNANLHLSKQRGFSEKVEGEITILDGILSYAPQKNFTNDDEDIIIIQNMKKESKKRDMALNIRINASKHLHYKTKEADLFFTPDITLYQESKQPMHVLGVVNIYKGNIFVNNKTFELDESEIYFYDEKYTNPYLNLNLHYYTIEDTDISIFITNRVDEPVIIFSSNPYMTQEDIISYILFGNTASSVFDTTKKITKASIGSVVLGAGLKELVNKSTSIKIDKINILTNENGTLGYEIGTRFNKRVRIVYKNDEISSLVLQYGINKFLRLDVDIKETGQGVTLYYMKDF